MEETINKIEEMDKLKHKMLRLIQKGQLKTSGKSNNHLFYHQKFKTYRAFKKEIRYLFTRTTYHIKDFKVAIILNRN